MSASHPAPDAATQTTVLAHLRCPVCAAPLHPYDREVRCPKRHSFNIAKQGYLGLLSGFKATSGDDAAMAAARDTFLSSGAYAPLAGEVAARAAAIVAAASDGRAHDPSGERTARHGAGQTADRNAAAASPVADPPFIVEAGCGTGYYLAAALDAVPEARGFGFDTGVRGLRRATRAHNRAIVGSWDVYRPFPLADGCADVVLDVFSPRNPDEFARVLRPGGALVVARPSAEHLCELRAALSGMVRIDPVKEDRLHRALDGRFSEGESSRVEYTIQPTLDQARALVAMTPSARHADAGALTTDSLPTLITVSVLVSTWWRRAG